MSWYRRVRGRPEGPGELASPEAMSSFMAEVAQEAVVDDTEELLRAGINPELVTHLVDSVRTVVAAEVLRMGLEAPDGRVSSVEVFDRLIQPVLDRQNANKPDGEEDA